MFPGFTMKYLFCENRYFKINSIPSPRIRYLFRENTMNSLSLLLYRYEFPVCFANWLSFWRIYYVFTWSFVIHYDFPRNHYEFNCFLASLLWIQCLVREFTIFDAYIPWIHYPFCELEMKSLSFSLSYYEFTVCFANLLSLTRIHYLFGEFTMNFREITINSLFFSRIYYKFTVFIVNLVRIHFIFPEFTIISVGALRINFEFTIHFANSLWIHSFFHYRFTIYFSNLLWI